MFSLIRKIVVGVEGLMKISLLKISDLLGFESCELTMQCMSWYMVIVARYPESSPSRIPSLL